MLTLIQFGLSDKDNLVKSFHIEKNIDPYFYVNIYTLVILEKCLSIWVYHVKGTILTATMDDINLNSSILALILAITGITIRQTDYICI